MSKALISSIAFGVLIAGSAVAAEMPLKAPPAPPPVFSWEGWYIGVNGGGAWGTTSTTLDVQNSVGVVFSAANIAVLDAAGANSFHNHGWLAGGQIGWVGETVAHFAYGFELAVDATQFRGSISNTQLIGVPAHSFTINDGFNNNTSWLATLLGRVGYDFGGGYAGFGGFIPYWTIGVAATQVRHNFSFVDNTLFPGCGCAVAFGSEVVGGAAVGGGVEVRFIDHWSIRGEYLYVDFGSVHGMSEVAGPRGTIATFFHGASFKENIARGFLSYKF